MAKQYTRDLIREEFINLLNKKRLKNITVQDIADSCDINRNTFYYYYSDIYQVLTEIFEEELSLVIEEYNDNLSLEESFLLASKFALNNRLAISHVYDSIKREELKNYIFNVSGNIMTRYINRISRGIDCYDYDKKLIAFFYQSALTEIVLQWISSGMKEDPEEIIRRIGDLFKGNIELSILRSKN